MMKFEDKIYYCLIYIYGRMPTLLVDGYELLSLLDPRLRYKEVAPDIGKKFYPWSTWQIWFQMRQMRQSFAAVITEYVQSLGISIEKEQAERV